MFGLRRAFFASNSPNRSESIFASLRARSASLPVAASRRHLKKKQRTYTVRPKLSSVIHA